MMIKLEVFNSVETASIVYVVSLEKIHIIKKLNTTTENNKVTVNVVEDRSNFKIGKGRVETPDDNIFKPDTTHQIGSIEICDVGWGTHKVTPEQNEERIDKIETEMKEMKKDITELKTNGLSMLD